jgi:Domain of unknown function (DUF222)/HNH endonuclease
MSTGIRLLLLLNISTVEYVEVEVGAAVSVGELGDEIALLAAQLDAGTHRLLTCIRQFDGSEEWHHQGAQSCAHWLTWRIGLDPATAREKVRVARAPGQLPVLDAALAAGRISYAKVRAITRVATPETKERLVEMAAFATGAQLERICRRYRGLRGQFMREEAERTGERAGDGVDTERMIFLRNLANGMVRLEATLQPDEADLVMKAIDKARDELRRVSLGGAQSLDPSARAGAKEAREGAGHGRGEDGSCGSSPGWGIAAGPEPGEVEEGGRVEGDGASAETPAVAVSAGAVSAGAPAAGAGSSVTAGERGAVAIGARTSEPAAAELRLPLPGRADALLFMAEASLKGRLAEAGMPGASSAGEVVEGASPEPRRPDFGGDRYRILIHLSESLVGPDAHWDAFLEDGTLLSAEAFRRVSCDGGLVPVVVTSQPTNQTSEAGGVLDVDVDVGRQSRAIPAALRRALWLRDAGCRFPGCANRRFIHGHHLRHWVTGGETSLQNLALLCSFHHRLVHEGGFRVRRDLESGALEWFDPRGRPIPAVPSRGLAADQTPSLLALGERGIALSLDANINACGWDGDPLDYEAIFDALVCVDPLFASA